MRGVMGTSPIGSPRARVGCMGCLTRIVVSMLGLIVVTLGVSLALQYVFNPWGFYLGGHFHLIPGWRGVSRIRRPDGEYVLDIYLQPTKAGRYSKGRALKGNGHLCTPRGDRFPMVAWGQMNNDAGFASDGKQMKIEFHRRPWYFQITGDNERRPGVRFGGDWQDPDLVGDDGGSFARAFLPDGSLGKSQYDSYHENAPNKLPMVFHEVSAWRNIFDDCRAK
jgi:hypothetical protein